MSAPETKQVILKGWPEVGPVLINVDDFDPEIHAELEEPEKPKRGRPKKAEIDNANG